jgi:hypothetical protein
MRLRRIIRLVLVVSMIAPMPLLAGGPLWGALGVPMQANGPLLDPSYSSYWVWRSIDRERRLREARVEKFGPNGPAAKPRSFLDDLSLEQSR